jgi:hypothetical protein
MSGTQVEYGSLLPEQMKEMNRETLTYSIINKMPAL